MPSPRYCRWSLTGGALMVALAVAAGAFGAHALRGVLTEAELTTYATATRYLGLHGLGLLILAALAATGLSVSAVSRWLTLGVGIFSGSLYILCLSELRWVAWLTPLGGVMMLGGWLLLAWRGWRS